MMYFDLLCDLFGDYIAYWHGPYKVQFSNFLRLEDALVWLFYVDAPWVVFKHTKIVARSSFFLGV